MRAGPIKHETRGLPKYVLNTNKSKDCKGNLQIQVQNLVIIAST